MDDQLQAQKVNKTTKLPSLIIKTTQEGNKQIMLMIELSSV